MAKAKPKVDPIAAAEELALQTLSASIANPAEPLFVGSTAKVKAAAEVAIQRGWITASEQLVGKKKTNVYQATPAGIEHALLQGETVQLVKGMKGAVEGSGAAIANIESQLRALRDQLQKQAEVLERLVERTVPPDLSRLLKSPQPTAATPEHSVQNQKVDLQLLGKDILDALREFKKRANAGQFCTLKDLHDATAGKQGATIGEFHECLRELDRLRKIRLVPWGAPMHQLQDELYAMILGKEVKFYAYLEE